MKAAIVGSIITVALGVVVAPQVGAQSVQTTIYNDKLQVSGRVLPVHTVLVDGSNTITEIVSNTDENAVPQFYRGSVSPANRITATNAINSQYQSLVQSGDRKVGVLYTKEAKAHSKSVAAFMTPGVIRKLF